MSDRIHPLTVSLGEARLDIEDVSTLNEVELEQLGSEAKLLIKQIEDLAFQLAMLAEEKFENTRYTDSEGVCLSCGKDSIFDADVCHLCFAEICC